MNWTVLCGSGEGEPSTYGLSISGSCSQLRDAWSGRWTDAVSRSLSLTYGHELWALKEEGRRTAPPRGGVRCATRTPPWAGVPDTRSPGETQDTLKWIRKLWHQQKSLLFSPFVSPPLCSPSFSSHPICNGNVMFSFQLISISERSALTGACSLLPWVFNCISISTALCLCVCVVVVWLTKIMCVCVSSNRTNFRSRGFSVPCGDAADSSSSFKRWDLEDVNPVVVGSASSSWVEEGA